MLLPKVPGCHWFLLQSGRTRKAVTGHFQNSGGTKTQSFFNEIGWFFVRKKVSHLGPKGESFSFTGQKHTFNYLPCMDMCDLHSVPTPQSPHSPGPTFQRVHMKPEIVIIVIQNLWPPELDTVVLW
jgi:hypothetical protein